MNNDKSIYACYEEIKRREIRELKEAVRKAGCEFTFNEESAPIVMCNFNGFVPHPADVIITRIELRDEEDEDVLHIFGQEKDASGCADWYGEEKKINLSDIAYGHIDYITSKINWYIERKENLLLETVVQLSADIYKQVYDKSESFTDASEEIIRLAKKFEKELCWQEDDPRDYITELEAFEKEYLDSIKED